MSSFKKTAEELLAKADVNINGDRPWDIQIHNEDFYARVMAKGSMGAGESYMDGWWDVEKLDEFFARVFSVNIQEEINKGMVWDYIRASLINMQSRDRSQKVAKEHYDLGNAFYQDMLDKNMQYTCAYWKDAQNLDQAQENKLKLICDKLQLKPGEKVLELGGGWGGFAYYAAENYGVEVESYNISKEQVEFCREWCKDLPVTMHHKDYRDATGTFDKVVSIGMAEHVGYKNYRSFMELADARLKKGGVFLLHTIAGNRSVKGTDPWIDKYIFPNSMLPSAAQLTRASEGLFVAEDLHNIGPHYDLTLMAWDKNFRNNWDKYKEQYGERFYRMWRFYLMSSAGQFRSRKIQLYQFVFSKGEVKRYDAIR